MLWRRPHSQSPTLLPSCSNRAQVNQLSRFSMRLRHHIHHCQHLSPVIASPRDWLTEWTRRRGVSVIYDCVSLQPATCGSCAPWTWSRWQASRRCRKPPAWLWAPTLHPPLPSSTSKCPPRESPSLTTRGSEYREYHIHTHTRAHTRRASLPHNNGCLSAPRLFFRRHYNVNTVIFCALDPKDRKWVYCVRCFCTNSGFC